MRIGGGVYERDGVSGRSFMHRVGEEDFLEEEGSFVCLTFWGLRIRACWITFAKIHIICVCVSDGGGVV